MEPGADDTEITNHEVNEQIEAIFGMIHKRYADILRDINMNGMSFDEIAEREGEPRKNIYNRYERAKIKAKEAADKLEPKPPTAIIMPIVIKLIDFK